MFCSPVRPGPASVPLARRVDGFFCFIKTDRRTMLLLTTSSVPNSTITRQEGEAVSFDDFPHRLYPSRLTVSRQSLPYATLIHLYIHIRGFSISGWNDIDKWRPCVALPV